MGAHPRVSSVDQSTVRWPQTLAMSVPPHVSGSVQSPQSREPPQPSAIGPHSAPSASHVVRSQPSLPHW